MPTLGKAQTTPLCQASSKRVKDAFQSIGLHLVKSNWLDRNNPHTKDCIQTLVNQTQPGQSINDNDLSEYISVSAPLHCVDGWSLLGRAISAHTTGDSSTAVHLAYYAELRAAMSLLAAEGIGVFNDRHFAVTSAGKCKPIGKLDKKGSSNLRTHDIAWLALEYWSGLKRSADLLREIIRPNGIALGGWIDAFGVTMSRSVAKKWLRTWGLDLKRLSAREDRDARNQASYRPTHLNQGSHLGVSDSSDFVRKLWTFCEPSALSRFDTLDRHLLRLILKESYEALPGAVAGKFEDRISTMLGSLFSDAAVRKQWMDFLLRKSEPSDPIIVTEAARTYSLSHPRHHLQVMSRASLLLRVSTGACTQLLQSGPFDRTKLEFWWKPLGEERGLWESGNEPTTFMDLWADIDQAIGELDEWHAKYSGPTASFSRWRQDLARPISVMGECERIALWGLGL